MFKEWNLNINESKTEFVHVYNDRHFTIHNTDDNSPNTDSISNGGGSIIYVSERLNPTRIEEFKGCDSFAVQISTNVGLVNVV